MALRIEDYALIGDTHTAALVGRDGSIDWLCLPRFDSPACFAALLGTDRHGRWRIAPAADIRQVKRRYVGRSLVLETTFETGTGRIRLVDCMPPRTGVPDVVRIVEGIDGEVSVEMDLVVRFDYGSVTPWVRRAGDSLRMIAGPDAVALWSPVPTYGTPDLRTRAEFIVRRGDRLPFIMVWYPSHLEVPEKIDGLTAEAETEKWWEDWASGCTYDGPWRDHVIRSLVTLKALTYAPTGGIVAAPTTSLPELIGGVRNWDYRYCWLRDATLTLFALMVGGFMNESAEWRNWLLRAVAGDPSKLQIFYGVAGERRLPEYTIDWLPGYEGSSPVRVGNAAVEQLQLDVYGEVMDALHIARRAGLPPDDASWQLQRALMRFLSEAWQRPDEGIWEVRGPSRHFTHSKVLCWVAADRAVKAVEDFGLEGPLEDWRRLRAAIHDDVCRRGFNEKVGAFTQSYGSDVIDASLLVIPQVGFLPPDDPRVIGTVHAVERELLWEGFVKRYPTSDVLNIDGLPGSEGAFLACSFWLADNYVLQGRLDDARRLFERLLGLANDVGLLAEEYDPVSGRLVGNFPQAFSHVALVNTARNIASAHGPAEERGKGRALPEVE